MKLHQTANQQYQTVTAYAGNAVEINAVRYQDNLLVQPTQPPVVWTAPSFDALSAEHFEQIAELGPDVVILGTGARQRFVHPRLTAALSERRIGLESMDSGAACRTYNVLMGEDRRVLLALLLEQTPA
jgi:uncharacterized protein